MLSPKKHESDDRSAEAAAEAAELVRLAKEQRLVLTGPAGLLKFFTKNVLETALNAALAEHFGHEKNRPTLTVTAGTSVTGPGARRF